MRGREWVGVGGLQQLQDKHLVLIWGQRWTRPNGSPAGQSLVTAKGGRHSARTLGRDPLGTSWHSPVLLPVICQGCPSAPANLAPRSSPGPPPGVSEQICLLLVDTHPTRTWEGTAHLPVSTVRVRLLPDIEVYKYFCFCEVSPAGSLLQGICNMPGGRYRQAVVGRTTGSTTMD